MSEEFDLWKLLAGLGIFMFGMFLMEESVKKLSGRAFKRLIREYTTGKLKSISSGAMVTAVLQSSSAVSLMILAFVGAGIMTMENAIGVILGSNLGTTITGWIVATVGFKMNIEAFALPLIGIGGLGLIFLGRSERYSNISKLLVGFGFLFMGLDYMKGSVEVYASNFDMSAMPDYGLIAFVGIGIALTALMQSSSATMAIILTAVNAGIVSFDSAAAAVVGANVGTTVTILLGSIGAVQVKKRVAYSHFAFNLITGLAALLLMPVLIYLVNNVFGAGEDAVLGLALFHTTFNLLGVLIFLPFTQVFAKMLLRFFPDKKAALTLFINQTTTDIPEAAATASQNEVEHLIKKVLRHNLEVLQIDQKLVFSNHDYSGKAQKSNHISLERQYENLNQLQAELFTFASHVQKNELTEMEAEAMTRYMHAARMALHSAKTLKDIKADIDEFQSADNLFLNDQYTHFRKRLIECYLKIDSLLESEHDNDHSTKILKLLKRLKNDDEKFVLHTTQAIQTDQIHEKDVSTAIMVNRAFVQSSRQILLAIRDLYMTNKEIREFEHVQEVTNELIKQE